MIRKSATMALAGVSLAGILGATVAPVSAAQQQPPRRVIVSGTVWQEDDETFGDEHCTHTFFENDVAYYDSFLLTDTGWPCDGEVWTRLIAYADLLPDGAIRYHGKVVLHEGTCGCASDSERKTGEFNQVVARDGNSHIETGIIEWDGGDATSISFEVYNYAG